MRLDAKWNPEGFWESPGFSMKKSDIKIPITKCDIIINEFGFIDLYLDDKKLKRIDFDTYLKFKSYVKTVTREDLTYATN